MKLREFAKQLGLSTTTVSRALSGYPEVSEATRARVASEAKRLGYRPDANAVRLKTGRAGAIGVMMGRSEFHFTEFMWGMAQRLETTDTDIVITPVDADNDDDEMQAYRRLHESRRVDAVILHSPRPNDPRIDLLNSLGLPFLVHGRSETEQVHAWLDIDNENAVRRATEHLLDLGHRRIALINGLRGRTYSIHREQGFCAALQYRGLAADPNLIVCDKFTDESGLRHARSFLENVNRPTAIVAGSTMTALGVYRAIRSLGLSVGQDVSVIAHDDVFPFLTAENMVPSLSATRSSMRAAGARCAELTLQIIAGRPVQEIHELWPVELILRESTMPPRRSS
ncbi:transcriptional regulator [Brucella endophytica]|uniref:Transcriptional regulator n=1 Tax=Brucella endophytica TaxID=1963359 RepID=A0A916WI28_9HYPH|nr:substrate-binding domain-containing protein [Brucella endophytica]GGA99232.1 transcriptional regulator [Brucella endophytica]